MESQFSSKNLFSRRLNVDITVIERQLGVKPATNKSAKIVVWIISQVPTASDITKIIAVCTKQSRAKAGNALLIILAATYNPHDVIPYPFQELINQLNEAFEEHVPTSLKVRKKHYDRKKAYSSVNLELRDEMHAFYFPRLRIMEYHTWPLAIASMTKDASDAAQQASAAAKGGISAKKRPNTLAQVLALLCFVL